MIEYYLHVDLIVPASKAREYETLTEKFLKWGGFRRLEPSFDNELVLALKTPEAFKYAGHEPYQSAQGQYEQRDRRPSLDEPVFRYVNLWRVRDLADLDLAQVMTRCADDDLYTDIDALVAREVQNYVVRTRWLEQPSAVPTDATHYVRVIRQFDSKDLGAYLFKAGALLPFLARHDWYASGHFQNITGRLNTVIEFWRTKNNNHERRTMDSVLADIEGTAGPAPSIQTMLIAPFRELPQTEVRESLVAVPYPCTNRRTP
jgi:hypothetical protein